MKLTALLKSLTMSKLEITKLGNTSADVVIHVHEQTGPDSWEHKYYNIGNVKIPNLMDKRLRRFRSQQSDAPVRVVIELGKEVIG